MTRAHASALALVNWKGVFYERYLLDRHVTALEGANGAGKTTVMIAAYVVLLPDMSRLRFTNLGETGATGGDRGIWGRLGDPGRPSYAALDFALPAGRRLVAGVHLERKGEPSVEPTPFIVSGLAEDVRLQDLLLVSQGDSEVVPELPELRESAARLGGRLQAFPSAREYFAELFDRGVTPLRLGTDEERNKLNEMLRTSMTGGISRALTSELRAFLLKEEGGLADTLQRMRANLDACRRTRTEVQESRRLEHEIGRVFEAGQAMFAAAFLATRERADELSRRVADAEAARAAAVEARAAAQEALEATVAELEALERRRGELGQALESSRAWLARMREALAAAGALGRCVAALGAAEEAAAAAAQARAGADEERARRREELRRAQESYKRAAGGLADVQRGIEELHRRAGAYHQAVRRLREAEGCLGAAPLAPEGFGDRLAAARAELDAVDQERRDAATRLSDADDHRRRHAEVMEALRALVAGEVEAERAHDVAVEALRRHRELVALAGRLPAIEGELGEARRLEARQERARRQAEGLGVSIAGELAAALVERLLSEAEAEREGHDDEARTARAGATGTEAHLKELEARRRELAAREPEWRELDARAARLGAHVGAAVADRAGLDAARATLAERLVAAQRSEELSREAQERLLREARELLAAGGPFAPELLQLKDRLGAELVALGFEDVALHEAAEIEARLGGLAQALVVDDPGRAARALAGRPDTLGDVLLVSREADLDRLASARSPVEVGDRDVAVDEGIALRVSRIPSHPRLGRRAREERAAALRREAEEEARELHEARARRRELERLVADGEALLAGHAVWLAGDPAPALAAARRAIVEAEAHLERHRGAIVRHAEAARALRPRVDGLRALLGEAMLLDPPHHGERARALDAERAAALSAKASVASQGRRAELVDRQLATLRQPPLSGEELALLRGRVLELKARRERLDAGIDALSYVRANVEALGWEEAPRRLAADQALVPAIQAQLREAEEQQREADTAARGADDRHDDATARFQDADGRRRVAAQEHAAAAERFEALGVPAPSEEAAAAAAGEVSRLDGELRASDGRRDALLTTRGRQEGALREAEGRAKEADEKLTGERREAEPAVKRWDDLRERAAHHGLGGGPLAGGPTELGDVRGHVNLVQEARTRREILLERLRAAQGGVALLTELQVLRDTSDAAFADAYLGLWLTVRDWLRRRLPAQVAEVDDPREALLRLRDQLSTLEERLARQESDLRGASEDVARGIDVQIRKARGQVTRLNKNLEGVSFGSIQGICVRLHPVERMDQVLRALREGAAQGLLFQADMPIEEALDEIFRRYGGGRTGGQRLLDYREYVHLQVEIRRKAGADWEIANPTRLSTGEAIGVGAALMMVVLTEWERDATLLRGKKSHGSLRFLFLDEANRLSHDNLGVLFDLCQTLDLQLLIAAPEVARAEGNTTYRLVRRATPDGREEVLVSGRRTRAEA
ncbi:cell division protein [Sorangium cellulosum So ce56]|uniref:Cell division protein n=1 Tax=Sorangium cellulosum (strain So ce56) TaxID=448385 RepID=A9G7H0_SORC5|nr:chromosome partition protein MukB [Sorangium cellulosum]CAN95857.1 cell division protein [Sorangium cellulosum So ce56]